MATVRRVAPILAVPDLAVALDFDGHPRRAAGDVHMPDDRLWGQHEREVVDPDANVLRFDSPLVP